jgi:hypothetical protein
MIKKDILWYILIWLLNFVRYFLWINVCSYFLDIKNKLKLIKLYQVFFIFNILSWWINTKTSAYNIFKIIIMAVNNFLIRMVILS